MYEILNRYCISNQIKFCVRLYFDVKLQPYTKSYRYISIFVEVTQCIQKYFKLFTYVNPQRSARNMQRVRSKWLGSRDPLEYLHCSVLVPTLVAHCMVCKTMRSATADHPHFFKISATAYVVHFNRWRVFADAFVLQMKQDEREWACVKQILAVISRPGIENCTHVVQATACLLSKQINNY